MNDPAILDSLPAVQRLALAYAPSAARGAWLGLLALDTRLAQLVRETSEPMLGQIRLAWWRERLQESPADRPRGEPLLALLGQHGAAFSPLVDGWEELLGEAPLPCASIAGFAMGRAEALAGLATTLGHGESAVETARLGRSWALADLALNLSHPEEREHAVTLLQADEPQPGRLPRALRPLVVLHGLAFRALRRDGSDEGVRGFLAAMRLGILGG
ncbi:MAG: hypothetical protein ABIQ81_05405 [Novosphingobium sp.]